MRLCLALLLVGGILAEDEDCPDFDCPVKDGSFAVSTYEAWALQSSQNDGHDNADDPRTLAHAVGITLASTSAPSSSTALLASTGTISSEEISMFGRQDMIFLLTFYTQRKYCTYKNEAVCGPVASTPAPPSTTAPPDT